MSAQELRSNWSSQNMWNKESGRAFRTIKVLYLIYYVNIYNIQYVFFWKLIFFILIWNLD